MEFFEPEPTKQQPRGEMGILSLWYRKITLHLSHSGMHATFPPTADAHETRYVRPPPFVRLPLSKTINACSLIIMPRRGDAWAHCSLYHTVRYSTALSGFSSVYGLTIFKVENAELAYTQLERRAGKRIPLVVPGLHLFPNVHTRKMDVSLHCIQSRKGLCSICLRVSNPTRIMTARATKTLLCGVVYNFPHGELPSTPR